MRCEEVRQQFADYLNGSLRPEALGAFDSHQAQCGACRNEIAELQGLWLQMGEVRPRTMDTPAMDTRFDAMIAAFKRGVDPAGASPAQTPWQRLQAWLTPVQPWRLAAAMGAMGLLLLIAGGAWLTLRQASLQTSQVGSAPSLPKPPAGNDHVTEQTASPGAKNPTPDENTARNVQPIPPPPPSAVDPLSIIATLPGYRANPLGHQFDTVGGLPMTKISTREGLSMADFIAPERYLTHVSTDKPIYRGGERLYVRGVILLADGHAPALTGTALVEIKGPKGETLASGVPSIVDGAVSFAWDVPANQAGGSHVVRISYPQSGDAPAERQFDVRAYRAPRLKSQIVFLRDGYGLGDTVTASLHVERAEGGIPASAKVSAVARVDGEAMVIATTTVDASGNARVLFKLPAAMARGEGVLAMTIDDGGAVETATKTIPILLQTLDLAIYPEGGDLIAGLPNRVYIEAWTPAQKPADMAGVVVNAAGKTVGAFRTEHEGRGRFTLTPVLGETYSLRVTEPTGIKTLFPLPAVQKTGLVLASTSDIILRQKDVVVRVAATASGNYGIALTQRGKEVAFTSVLLNANRPLDVPFALPRSLDGVLTATVYDARMTPLAERLLFRQPDRKVKVQVTADQKDFIPGDKVTLRVATTDETGKAVGAIVGLTVTDSSVLEMIDKREQAPQLPAMVLLENDVKNLADAHVYLDETNPKAALATDLLLGTQGWRRFATIDPVKFLAVNGDAARRALATRPPRSGTAGVTTQMAGLPAYENDPLTLIQSLPGYRANPLGQQFDTIGGLPMAMINTVRDGLSVTDGFNPGGVGANTILNPDMISEMRLILSAVDAEGGRNGGLTSIYSSFPPPPTGQITAVTPPFGNPGRVGTRASNVPVTIEGPNLSNDSTANQVFPLGTPASASQGVAVPLTITGSNFSSGGFSIKIPEQPTLTRVTPTSGRQGVTVPVTLSGTNFDRGDVGFNTGRFANPNYVNINFVREYAHARLPNSTEGARKDFTETVYWNAGVRTDAATGLATVSFIVSDVVTSFRVLADAYTQDGTLGSNISSVESVRPFYIEPKMPLQVTSGDVILLPIGIANGGSRELGPVTVDLKSGDGLDIHALDRAVTALTARERTRRLIPIDVRRGFSGGVDLTLDASAAPYRDSVIRKLDVQPLGYPHQITSGGVLTNNGSRSFEYTLPDDLVAGSASSQVVLYPTPLANMTEALQALLREPYGCFEQTSSTSYPLVMAQQYFMTHSGVEPAIIEKAKGLLEVSYKRLLGFESRSGGFDWFGGDPGHEALTAYGLLQFNDMKPVREVDSAMLARTRDWLLSRRDNKGGFYRDDRAHGGIGNAPPDTANAYITWALLESGEKGLDRQIAAVKTLANTTGDSYIVALGANILNASGDRAGARQLMEKLGKAQDASGAVRGASTSITRSAGESLTIETTALASLAWMHDPAFAGPVEKGLRWIVESNKNGRFGSTQSTILALRAIVAYDTAHAKTRSAGRILLTVDGKTVGSPIAVSADSQGAIVIPSSAGELGAGKHSIVLTMEDGSDLPFSVAVNYSSLRPDSSDKAKIAIQVALKEKQVREGGITEAVVSITNKSDEPLPTPMAIVGIPGGLEVRHDQLKELVKSGKIAAYEVRGREVLLYWRSIKAKDQFDLSLSLVAAVPGSYTGPSSRAYLYYTDEFKNWAPALTVNIAPR